MSQTELFCLLFVLVSVITYFGLQSDWRRARRELTIKRWREFAEATREANRAMVAFGESLSTLGITIKKASYKINQTWSNYESTRRL